MGVEEHQARACEVGEEEARAELERLLADQRFHATERSRSILQYIADRQFAGHADGVKAYSIALDVLGRPSSFDPSLDPIVRIELSRLRSSISQYYEAYGEESDITIHLPKGRYIAVFSRSAIMDIPPCEEPEDIAAYDDLPVKPVATASLPAFSTRRWPAIAIFVSGCVSVLLFAAGLYWISKRPQMTKPPTVMLSMAAADSSLQKEADATADYLLSALSQFRTLSISSQKSVPHASLATTLRPPPPGSYNIDLKYYGDQDDRSIWWQVVDTSGGNILKSGVVRVYKYGRSDVAVRDELVGALARRFASARGVIGNLETHSENADKALGNTCVLKAEYSLTEGDLNDIRAASGCLERTLAAEPGDSDAAAALSLVLIASYDSAPPPEVIDRAYDLAATAVSLAPLSDRANIAPMMAHFHSGRTDAAIEVGNRAMVLNPNNPDVLAKLGAVLFAAGFWVSGVSLAEDASRSVDVVPRDARLVLALDAYRRGDFSNASLIAEQIDCDDMIVSALKAAALGQLGSSLAADRLAKMRMLQPGFEANFASGMKLRRYQPELTASLQSGLLKADSRPLAMRAN